MNRETVRKLDMYLAAALVVPLLAYVIFYFDLVKPFRWAPWRVTGWEGLPVRAWLSLVLIPAALVGFGDALAAAAGLRARGRLDRLALNGALGLAGVCFLGWGLALAGLGRYEMASTVGVLILVIAGYRVFVFFRSGSGAGGATQVGAVEPGLGGLERGFLVLAGLAAALMLLRAMTPPLQVDELSDHLPLARGVLESGTLPLMRYRNYGYFPVFGQMGFVMTLPLGAVACRLLHAWAAVFTALELYLLGRKLRAPAAGAMAAAFFFSVPIALWTGALAFTDSFWFLFALAGVRRALFEPRNLGLSGLFFGCALISKLTVGGFLAATGLALAVQAAAERKLLTWSRLKELAVWAAIPALLLAPWLVRNWLVAGSPLAALLPGAAGPASPEFTAQYHAFMSEYGVGRSLHALLQFPSNITFWANIRFEANSFDPNFQIGPLPLMLAPALVVGALATARGRRLALVLAGGFAFWWLSFHVTRFLLPCVFIYLALAAAGLERLGTRFRVSIFVYKSFCFLALAATVAALGMSAGEFAPTALGLRSERDYMSRHPFYAMSERINARDDVHKLAMVMQTEDFLLDPPTEWINAHNGFAVDLGRDRTPEQVVERLRRLGVSHLLVNSFRLERTVFLRSAYARELGSVIMAVIDDGRLELVDELRHLRLYAITEPDGS